jgi:hypothetical protein
MKKIETNTRPPSHSGGKVRFAYIMFPFSVRIEHIIMGTFVYSNPDPYLPKTKKRDFRFLIGGKKRKPGNENVVFLFPGETNWSTLTYLLVSFSTSPSQSLGDTKASRGSGITHGVLTRTHLNPMTRSVWCVWCPWYLLRIPTPHTRRARPPFFSPFLGSDPPCVGCVAASVLCARVSQTLCWLSCHRNKDWEGLLKNETNLFVCCVGIFFDLHHRDISRHGSLLGSHVPFTAGFFLL